MKEKYFAALADSLEDLRFLASRENWRACNNLFEHIQGYAYAGFQCGFLTHSDLARITNACRRIIRGCV